MTLFVRVKGFISLHSIMCVSTAVVELQDSTNICMPINNTLAEVVCCCFSWSILFTYFLIWRGPWGHRTLSVCQVSCLLVLWLVRYASWTGRKRRIWKYAHFRLTALPDIINTVVVLQFKPELPYGYIFTLTKLELRKPQTESIISDFLIYTFNGKPRPSLSDMNKGNVQTKHSSEHLHIHVSKHVDAIPM